MKKLMKIAGKSLLLLIILLLTVTAAWAAEYKAATGKELYECLFTALTAQEEEFSIVCSGVAAEDLHMGQYTYAPLLVRAMSANLPNEDGTGPDVAMMNIRTADMKIEKDTLHFQVEYLLNQEKLDWVNEQLGDILDRLQLQNDSDYMKIKKIYKYMGTHFSYDSQYKYYTDYDGLMKGSMVCQGYALLTYKLLWRAGIPARIIVGLSGGEQHGWNLVKLEGQWYYLDTTWDSSGDPGGTMYWKFFLRAPGDFPGHSTDERFLESSFFQRNCPMAEKSYEVPSVEILVEGQASAGLILRNGKSVQFSAVLTPEADIPVHWSSTDETVVSVDENGLVSSLIPGSVTISAEAEDERYIPDTFPVTAVDLRTCSSWAEGALNDYYLRKLYPAALCSDYQSPITRGEFAYLLSTLLQSVPGENGILHVPEFSDIEGNPYWSQIIYCTARGIFQGTDSGVFSPNSPVTREQAAALLCDVLDYADTNTKTAEAVEFSDMDEAFEWSKPYIRRIAALGVLEGSGDGTFCPKAAVTREQAAVMLQRLYVYYLELLTMTD